MPRTYELPHVLEVLERRGDVLAVPGPPNAEAEDDRRAHPQRTLVAASLVLCPDRKGADARA
jgi:hypothetical protein